uniref:Bm7110, isoform d n=1 Tax=Brugia malayi TaxID=6279 RepID=A0A1I9G804_BRUMA|nr:Bm7110, isoform e [Brugia malayi]
MASLVKQFIDSLDGQVVELPDIELADLTEDSEATWAQNKTENEQTDQIEFLKRRIIATQELGDERYVGQKVSSKNVFTGGRISDLAHIRFDASTGVSENPDEFHTDNQKNEEDSSDSNSIGNSTDQESFSANDNVESEEKEDSELSQSKNKNVVADGVITISNDTQRGKAESVQKQLMIWDRLMQLHILSHAALRIFNQLPRDQLAKKLLQSADLDTKKNCRIMQKNLEQLNEIFTTMEDKLLKSAKQTKGFSDDNCGKRVENSDDEEIESLIDCNEEDDSAIESDTKESEGDSDICLSNASITQDNETVNRDQQILGKRKKLMPKELTKEYEKRHERFAAFQSSTLSKWDERTTLNAIGIIKNRKKDFSGFESVVLKQIEQIMNEKHRLLRRTQMKRHDVDRIGGVEGNDYDAEIFDDDDFYQQLLKELIERKSANVVDPVEMSRQWLEVQKLRQKRSKRRKVDTKASKGRKIRYVVIPKLVNFFPSMAEKATWSHEKRNQLFKSLFSS